MSFIFFGARHDDEPGAGQLRAVQHLHLQWRGKHRLVRQLHGATHPPGHEGQVCIQAFNPILHTAWLNNHALTLKGNTAKYYFGEKSSFLHTLFLKICCESRNI
jgi:hypothetical protein